MKILTVIMLTIAIVFCEPVFAIRTLDNNNNAIVDKQKRKLLPLDVSAFKQSAAEIAHNLYTIQQKTTSEDGLSEERLHELAMLDQKLLKLPPFLQKNVLKQALLLFDSVDCSEENSINDFYYVHLKKIMHSQDFLTEFNSGMFDQKYMYVFPNTTRENLFKEIRDLLNVLTKGNKSVSELFPSNNDDQAEKLLDKMIKFIKVSIDYKRSLTRRIEDELDQLKNHPIVNKFLLFCSSSQFGEIFLSKYNNGVLVATNVKEVEDEIVALIKNTSFMKLSLVMQEILILYMYKNMIEVCDFSEQEKQNNIAKIKKYYNAMRQKIEQNHESVNQNSSIENILEEAIK